MMDKSSVTITKLAYVNRLNTEKSQALIVDSSVDNT